MILGIVANRLERNVLQFWLQNLEQLSFVEGYSKAIKRLNLSAQSISINEESPKINIELKPSCVKIILAAEEKLLWLNNHRLLQSPYPIEIDKEKLNLSLEDYYLIAWKMYLAQLYKIQQVSAIQPSTVIKIAVQLAHKLGYRGLMLTPQGFMGIGNKKKQIINESSLEFLGQLYDLDNYLNGFYPDIVNSFSEIY